MTSPSELKSVGVLGAGRQALETSGYCDELGLRPVFYIEERPPEDQRDPSDFPAPILSFGDIQVEHLSVPVVSAVGDVSLRRRLVATWPGTSFLTVISSHAWLASDAVVGAGTTVAPHAALNRRVHVGVHCLINVGVILSHDVTVGDFVTLSPGTTVGGRVSIGPGTFLGLGAIVRDRVTIGEGAMVAAGAVVVGDVGDGEWVRGVPARSVPSG
jgi:sugar O-acyltransferase (sialic acid O-acetyltransferase NeuD family)